MICPNCGSENPAGAKFCNECAARLSGSCPACGAVNPPTAKFCSECATPLRVGVQAPAAGTGSAAADPRAPTHVEAAGSERRLVSVMFADLVGFTPLTENRDPEETQQLLRRYFELARDIIGRYGGTVEKFIGDAVMAVWGAPSAHEDDAERAVRAALDLVEAVPSLDMGGDAPLEARAGVLTGEAAITVGAVGEGLVAGDLVNTASRLQSVAQPGTVVVGEATRAATEASIAFEPLGPAELKGKSSPVAAFRALRVIAERGGAGRSDALEPPFVGRVDELRLLKEQFHATGRDGRARLVSLVGQAGIGKSRLAWELEKYLDGVVESVWWHRGRSPSYGEGLTFWALGEMIRRRAGLAEGDDETTTRAAISAMLARHVVSTEERRWIEPRLLALLGVETAPAGGREDLFAAWRTFFERLADESTVVLVFEDLHWADDGLLDFIEHLLDWSRSHPIFVVTLARPELLARRAGWGTDRRGAFAIRLEPLPPAAMRELLAGLVPGLPERIGAQILARADGIPLYAVEIVRMLVATGRLRREDDSYRPTARLDSLDVPPTLHALVAARLDALPAADRELLRDAAVLGQSFTVAALAAVSGAAAEILAPRLAGLVRQELLTVESDPRAPARGQHAFVQSLLREVAYSTLSRRDRRVRHLAAARYFEALDDDELAAALATHYLEAYRAAPDGPEGEAAAAQARIVLRAAAGRAEALGAIGQAAELLRGARVVARDAQDDVTLLQEVGRLEWAAGRYDQAEESLSAAVERTQELGDTNGVVRSTALLAVSLLGRAQIRRALDALEPALPAADRLTGEGADPTLALYFEAYARAKFRHEEYGDSIAWADRALPLAERSRLDEVVAMALITKASSVAALGRVREGLALLHGAILDARAHGQHFAALRGGVNMASFSADMDPQLSLKWTLEGIQEAGRLGLAGFFAYQVGNLGAADRLGQWDVAARTSDEMLQFPLDPSIRAVISDHAAWLAMWRGTDAAGRPEAFLEHAIADGDPQSQVNALEWLLDQSFLLEDWDAAVRYGRQLLERDFGAVTQRAKVGRVALHGGDLDLARRIVELVGPGPGGVADADLAMVRAGLAAREGRIREALEEYRGALTVYRDFGVRFDLALTTLDMATFVGGREPGVAAAVAEARQILVELGVTRIVERLDRVAGPAARAEIGSTASVAPARRN